MSCQAQQLAVSKSEQHLTTNNTSSHAERFHLMYDVSIRQKFPPKKRDELGLGQVGLSLSLTWGSGLKQLKGLLPR